jgi:hypothetical protein
VENQRAKGITSGEDGDSEFLGHLFQCATGASGPENHGAGKLDVPGMLACLPREFATGIPAVVVPRRIENHRRIVRGQIFCHNATCLSVIIGHPVQVVRDDLHAPFVFFPADAPVVQLVQGGVFLLVPLCALALRSLRCFFKAGVLWCRNNGLPSILVVGTVSSQ